jgi:hypothetical protein
MTSYLHDPSVHKCNWKLEITQSAPESPFSSTPAKNAPHAQNIFFAKHMIVMVVNAFGARGFSRLNVNYDELHESRKYGIQN